RRARPAPHPGRPLPGAKTRQAGSAPGRQEGPRESPLPLQGSPPPDRAGRLGAGAAEPPRRPRSHSAHERIPTGGPAVNPNLLTSPRPVRLSGTAEALPARLAQAEGGSLSFLEFLELLVEDELLRRADRLFARRVKQATISTVKELKDFDWGFNPKIPKTR